jgi:hypothetical protein
LPQVLGHHLGNKEWGLMTATFSLGESSSPDTMPPAPNQAATDHSAAVQGKDAGSQVNAGFT